MVASQAWNEWWNEWPQNLSATSASGAISRAVYAGSGPAAYSRASRNAPLAGFRLAVAPRSGHVLARRDVTSRRWVMSRTTQVSGILVSAAPAGLGGCPACIAASGLASRAFRPISGCPVHKSVHTQSPSLEDR